MFRRWAHKEASTIIPSWCQGKLGTLWSYPHLKKQLLPFVIYGIGMQNGEHFKRIRYTWKSIIRKGPEWGPQSCGASSSYKAWLKSRLEQISLTFGDPRLNVDEKPNLRPMKPYRSSKRKCEAALEAQIVA
ncbi:hypothetical protein CR513_51538, partial [Mucuna pruriens]